MKRLSTILLGLGLLAGSALYADGSHGNEHEKKVESSNNHMGNHMHEGKMTNHMNADGMPDKEIKKEVNDHMGNHMHEGKMTNHMNTNGMPDKKVEKKVNDHMGNHMHEGKMKNHMNADGMPDKEIKKKVNDHINTDGRPDNKSNYIWNAR